MLKPEVKQCLDKVMYQLDLCKNTLGLLENRISTSESNLQSVMNFIRTEDINYVSTLRYCSLTCLLTQRTFNSTFYSFQKPHLAQAVVAVNDSPEKAAHLYHPHLYKETVSTNEALLNTYSQKPVADSQQQHTVMEHRTVTHALLTDPLVQPLSAPMNTGGYDLMELRKKLEQRMEYSKVTTMPHDPAMDHD